MPQVRFLGSDPRAGRQIEGVTYFPGQVGEVSALWAAALVSGGLAELYHEPPPAERVAVADIEHRDTFRRAKRKP